MWPLSKIKAKKEKKLKNEKKQKI
jgi:hypothetical protein